jgi:hypothetical protein
MKATVHDIEPARLRRMVEQEQTQATARGIFADMADGALVMQFILNLWGYEWHETKFVLLIVALCGDAGNAIALFDEELAALARAGMRTVRRWRSDYLKRARRPQSGPLSIAEGEYNADQQRYERTRYTIVPAVAEAIARAVAEARALPEYTTDRHGALQRAAKQAYYDLPDVPPATARKRKPRSARLRAPVLQHVRRAQKALARGEMALKEMNDLQRAAVLAREGDTLRAELEAMQAKIAQLLSTLPANDDSAEVEDIPAKLASIPPAPEHTPEDVAMFDRLAARAAGAPAVRAVTVELCPPDPPPRELTVEFDDDLRFYVESRAPSVEELEAQAIRAEGCGGP